VLQCLEGSVAQVSVQCCSKCVLRYGLTHTLAVCIVVFVKQCRRNFSAVLQCVLRRGLVRSAAVCVAVCVDVFVEQHCTGFRARLRCFSAHNMLHNMLHITQHVAQYVAHSTTTQHVAQYVAY